MSSDMLDGYWRAPPIARTVATAAFVTSISVYLGALPAPWLTFMPEKLFTFPPQVWRIWSNFLVTGPQLSLLFDTYFLYSYTSALEVGNPRFSKKEDVIWYLLFVGGVITVSLCLLILPHCVLPCDLCSSSIRYDNHLVYLPAWCIPTATAVPENEEDHPHGTAGPLPH
ncbi:hypothetical protein BN1723_015150 [Verticillium longisporum]|uniref:Derlin n=1 Tax=Verticillium longisporum TaxID=100787 RepID=A0A0G4MRQ5_VERLO|nr:hypothetical protein BN1723_015150 [Verticillium longisporum]